MHIVKKHRLVHMESLGYDQNRPNDGLSQTEYYPHDQTSMTESEAFLPKSPSDYSDISGQSSESRSY